MHARLIVTGALWQASPFASQMPHPQPKPIAPPCTHTPPARPDWSSQSEPGPVSHLAYPYEMRVRTPETPSYIPSLPR
eukprot:4553429-Pleurochrysis_carterae.AAC.1